MGILNLVVKSIFLLRQQFYDRTKLKIKLNMAG